METGSSPAASITAPRPGMCSLAAPGMSAAEGNPTQPSQPSTVACHRWHRDGTVSAAPAAGWSLHSAWFQLCGESAASAGQSNWKDRCDRSFNQHAGCSDGPLSGSPPPQGSRSLQNARSLMRAARMPMSRASELLDSENEGVRSECVKAGGDTPTTPAAPHR